MQPLNQGSYIFLMIILLLKLPGNTPLTLAFVILSFQVTGILFVGALDQKHHKKIITLKETSANAQAAIEKKLAAEILASRNALAQLRLTLTLKSNAAMAASFKSMSAQVVSSGAMMSRAMAKVNTAVKATTASVFTKANPMPAIITFLHTLLLPPYPKISNHSLLLFLV